MKKLRQCLLFSAVLCIVLFFSGTINTQAAVHLNQTTATICVGKKTTLKLGGTSTKPKWSSSNKKIAKVSSKGVVTGVKSGKATITAKLGSAKYTCKVTVNKTYGVNKSAVTIKDNASVTVTYTEDSSISYRVENKDICDASWGTVWDGNDVQLNITPKKTGVTYINCTNGSNKETIRIKVKVTGVPVNITELNINSSDGGDFVCGVNTMDITFRQGRASSKTMLYIVSKEGETLRTIRIGKVAAKKKISISWDGVTDKGGKHQGQFQVKVVADDYATTSEDTFTCYSKSPFSDGNGTKEHPYEIATASNLKKMSEYSDRYFLLTQDIDLRSEIMESLFTAERPFQGHFSGEGHTISNLNGSSSLFGTIGEKGEVEQLTLQSFNLTGSDRAAILTEVNQGHIEECIIHGGMIYSSTNTDAAFLAVENTGVIESCAVDGSIYSGGSIAGGVVYNHQKLVSCTCSVNLNYMAAGAGALTSGELYVGSVAAVNENTAFINSCKGGNSTLYASGTFTAPITLYMGGLVGWNRGQVQDGSFLGQFGLANTSALSGMLYAGVITGKNDGILSGITYYTSIERQASGTGSGREDNLITLQNPYESFPSASVS